MSPRPRKAEDADVFAAVVRIMKRVGPAELTLRAIAAEAGVTAAALVQRFGSKRALLLAHARYAAATGDVGIEVPIGHVSSPLDALQAMTTVYAQLAHHLARPYAIWLTCKTTWRIRCCVVIYCGYRWPRALITNSWRPRRWPLAPCEPIRISRPWHG